MLNAREIRKQWPKYNSAPLGELPNGEPFYFDDGRDDGLTDYVYENGISLTCMDYRDALAVMRGVRPSEYWRGEKSK